jgi:hypothetical protein
MLLLCLMVLLPADGPETSAQAAQRLYRAAIETAPAASPAIYAAALRELAKLSPELDRAKTAELFGAAFAAAAADVTYRGRAAEWAQQEVVSSAAEVDLALGTELLERLPMNLRGRPAERIILALVAAKKLDRAVEVLDNSTGQGSFPYAGASKLMAALPADDGRRVLILAKALASADPKVAQPRLIRLLAEQRDTLARSSLQAAVTQLVKAALERKPDTNTSTLAGDGGSASFESSVDKDLFDLLPLLGQFDAGRVEEILRARPALAEMLKRYPAGRASLGKNLSGSGSSSADPALAGRARAQARMADALAKAKADPAGAVELASAIEDAPTRAEALAALAQAAGSRAMLGKASAALKDIHDPEATAPVWRSIAEAAHALGDDEAAATAITRGLEDCVQVYKLDVDEKKPNAAPRESWPSTQYFLALVHSAGRIEGVGAEARLSAVADADLQLLARIELVRALLGKPRGPMSIMVDRYPAR